MTWMPRHLTLTLTYVIITEARILAALVGCIQRFVVISFGAGCVFIGSGTRCVAVYVAAYYVVIGLGTYCVAADLTLPL
eukprot:6147553-Pyramimonas_sp.AAC.1